MPLRTMPMTSATPMSNKMMIAAATWRVHFGNQSPSGNVRRASANSRKRHRSSKAGQPAAPAKSTLLLTVHSDGDWQVVRVGLDGTQEVATEAVPGEDFESSLVLAQQP